MREQTKKSLKKYCDKLWSLLVKEIAGNRCELCGATTNLQSHHVFGRRANSTRFVEENGVCLCWRCHFVEAEQNSTKFGIWIVEKRGREWFDELNRTHNRMVKIGLNDYKVLADSLKARLEEVRNPKIGGTIND